VLDFTSALYLGLRHASASLPPWAQLTAGVPAALETPALARTVAGGLAELTGTERATLAPSTLHAFWDLFVSLSGSDVAILVDAGAYPIARWGVERAASRGVPARTFAHHDPADLWRRLTEDTGSRRRPLVVADGLCPGCGRLAPLAQYLERAREFGGKLIVDDTQALGILGRSPGPRAPYGVGGGGSLRRHGIASAHVILVSSLGKGLGVPIAMLGGSAAGIARLEARSATRVHCSPPSFADLHAAAHALGVNHHAGEALRLRLARLVRRLRGGLRASGLSTAGSLLPVQGLRSVGIGPADLHERLQRSGIRALLHRPTCGGEPRVSLIVTARHTPAAIDRAVQAVAAAAGAVAAGDHR
jgi:8-amino-7-oxononanoate synthase